MPNNGVMTYLLILPLATQSQNAGNNGTGGEALVGGGGYWDASGCRQKDLCECKLNGAVAGIKGTDIALSCQENGLATPKEGEMWRIEEALQNDRFNFECDSLKLNVYCYSMNGCLIDDNVMLCQSMKGSECDVICDRAPVSTGLSAIAIIFATLLPRVLS
eukprot:gnl/TRDRNA2_/TRDRNA2_188816_c0_seq1.p1 gnl/TRDRNA2_/TRDRNA2_188816_c0~~gnl/TRDRNA2_/TRDRNA2_188816_c0_seq1.p1  ORF type:complete len:186 (-),score=27.79 gnl/TRDRNA2_/TRDRNA2_188816_c0_seq1:513-995(-)